jgi:hypothetical protein
MSLLLLENGTSSGTLHSSQKDISQMQLSHARPVRSIRFDDPNLVSSAGLVSVMALAHSAGLRALVDGHLSVPTDKGANAGLKVSSLVGGMLTGADSIDDMAVLRHSGMGTVFDCAPSTLGSFLRAFSFGHVRQLDAVASRLLIALASGPGSGIVSGIDDLALVDIDDTIVEVHGHAKAGAGFGYTRVRGLNAAAVTVTTAVTAPVIVATRLRKGSANSARGAARITSDALATVRRLRSTGATGMVLVRADSAYFGRPVVHAARKAGARVSITVRQDATIRAAIASIPDDAWTPIAYPNAILDEQSGQWFSAAEVAEIGFTAFAARTPADRVPAAWSYAGSPTSTPPADPDQASLFGVWRFHAFFTTTDLDTVTADKVHRQHAIIESVFADLKDSALAHLPSGSVAANSAWLVLAAIAFNLTRAAGALTDGPHARACTGTIRRKIINTPARISSSARRLTMHLPIAWPWETASQALFDDACGPPAAAATRPPAEPSARPETPRGTPRKNRHPENCHHPGALPTSPPYGRRNHSSRTHDPRRATNDIRCGTRVSVPDGRSSVAHARPVGGAWRALLYVCGRRIPVAPSGIASNVGNDAGGHAVWNDAGLEILKSSEGNPHGRGDLRVLEFEGLLRRARGYDRINVVGLAD